MRIYHSLYVEAIGRHAMRTKTFCGMDYDLEEAMGNFVELPHPDSNPDTDPNFCRACKNSYLYKEGHQALFGSPDDDNVLEDYLDES